jgi:hypothetical protein
MKQITTPTDIDGAQSADNPEKKKSVLSSSPSTTSRHTIMINRKRRYTRPSLVLLN